MSINEIKSTFEFISFISCFVAFITYVINLMLSYMNKSFNSLLSEQTKFIIEFIDRYFCFYILQKTFNISYPKKYNKDIMIKEMYKRINVSGIETSVAIPVLYDTYHEQCDIQECNSQEKDNTEFIRDPKTGIETYKVGNCSYIGINGDGEIVFPKIPKPSSIGGYIKK